jgi:tRNA (guanine-N7-)-methyltransferase
MTDSAASPSEANTEQNAVDSTQSTSSKFTKKIRSFVRRSGRMTAPQKIAYDKLWPKYGRMITDGVVDLSAWFDREAESNHDTILEIGFGMGDSLLKMAQANPDKNYIGIEIHLPGLGRLLNEIDKAGVTNIRLYQEDAVEVLEQCLVDNSLAGMQLYFPDPWHKARHHKRRIVKEEFVQHLRKKLKVGGTFHMATDWENYAEHMLEVMTQTQGYENTSTREDGCIERPESRPLTKFEQRGHRLGHGVWDIVFAKTL